MSLYLDHDEFVRRYHAKEVRCLIDRSAAMHVADQVKEVGGCAHQGCKVMGCLLPLAGLVLLIFVWPLGLLFIVLGSFLIQGLRKTACQNVIALALKDPVFYKSVIESGVMQLR